MTYSMLYTATGCGIKLSLNDFTFDTLMGYINYVAQQSDPKEIEQAQAKKNAVGLFSKKGLG